MDDRKNNVPKKLIKNNKPARANYFPFLFYTESGFHFKCVKPRALVARKPEIGCSYQMSRRGESIK